MQTPKPAVKLPEATAARSPRFGRRFVLRGCAAVTLSALTFGARAETREDDPELSAEAPKPVRSNALLEETADVAVVGSGAAGLSAAVAALEAGATSVVVLERFSSAGGHSIHSSGSFAAVRGERAIGDMVRAMLDSGAGMNDPELVRALAEESWGAREWLAKFGIDWIEQPFRAVGSPIAFNWSTGSSQSGYDYVQALNRALHERGGRIRYRACASGLLFANPADGGDPEVAGVYAETPEGTLLVRTRAVVVAAGGFTANRNMIARWRPDINRSYPTTANPRGELPDGALGDGIRLCEEAGAELVGMDAIEVVPFSGGRLTDYVGGEIWLNARGERFVYEGESFEVIRERILAQPEGRMWAVSDVKSAKGATLPVKLMSGTVSSARTLEELAAGLGVPAARLRETLERYNRSVRAGWDEEFGRPLSATPIDSPPYFYGLETFSIHYTCGGVAITRDAEVRRSDGRVIPGLYAAGETTGGVHGRARLGGCALTDCVVFGRIAGTNAAMRASGDR